MVDWVGVIALIAGCVVPMVIRWWLIVNEWSYPWILSAYAVAFAVCIGGRASGMIFGAEQRQPQKSSGR